MPEKWSSTLNALVVAFGQAIIHKHSAFIPINCGVGGLLDRVLSLLYISFRPLLRFFLFKSLSFLSVKLRHPLFAEVRS
ncbi:hypothetical protein BvCmsOUNP037_04571 [Escherichia coli]|nr:hypothetical protein BvCmsOUNP013_02355 [Escherichia coli]GDS10682.1 hypothetical protein BvCmsOUNP037_04571 [Escherichia coli]